MALDSERIQLFLQRIEKSEMATFQKDVCQLFQHLSTEGINNPIYQKYEQQATVWENWLEEPGSDCTYEKKQVPADQAQAKSLAYSLYKSVADCYEKDSPIALGFYDQQDFNAFIDKFNATFLEYLTLTVEDIVKANRA